MASYGDVEEYRFNGTVLLNIGTLPAWANDEEVEVVTIWVKENQGEYGRKNSIISFRINEFVGLYNRGNDLVLGIHKQGHELTEIFIPYTSGIHPVICQYTKVADNIDAHQTPIEFTIESGEITGMISTS